MNVLHQTETFLLAQLPQFEQGVTHLISKAGDKVLLHRILQTGEIVSSEMNVPVLRAILQAVDAAIPA